MFNISNIPKKKLGIRYFINTSYELVVVFYERKLGDLFNDEHKFFVYIGG